MIRGYARRGQPLMVLALLLGGWVAARAAMWEGQPIPRPAISAVSADASAGKIASRPEPPPVATRRGIDRPASIGLPATGEIRFAPSRSAIVSQRDIALSPPLARASGRVAPDRLLPRPRPAPVEAPMPAPGAFEQSFPYTLPPAPRPAPMAPAPVMEAPGDPVARSVAAPARIAVSTAHQLMWMAALSKLPLASALAAQVQPEMPAPFYPASREPALRDKRWSLDSWVLWRRGGAAQLASGLPPPSYGASQAGGVIRFRLVPSSRHRPAIYLRTTAALDGSQEREAALGLSVRPIAGLPIAAAAEARYTDTPFGRRVRPAGFVVTELPTFELPGGFRGEAYGQAGYVGGKLATAFADGQLRVDHRFVRLGKFDLRLGGAAWGGAQKGASRLDIGPSLTLGGPLSQSSGVRLGADWRFRVAGQAAPRSGPAITLSAGF